jgi:hypothetical protein
MVSQIILIKKIFQTYKYNPLSQKKKTPLTTWLKETDINKCFKMIHKKNKCFQRIFEQI